MADEKEEPTRVIFQIVTRAGDGRVESTKSVYENEKGKRVPHGPSIDYHDNGRKWTEVHYRDGHMHGKFCHWASNGQPTLEGTYCFGKREGLWTEWHLTTRRKWLEYVNEPVSDAELAALRRSVVRGIPYGSTAWVESTARKLGLEATLRKPGRPKKR